VSGSLSSYEELRLAVLAQMESDQLDAADPGVVEQVVRSQVAAFESTAVRGHADRGQRRALADPARTVEQLMRSLTEAGPATKYFTGQRPATELIVKGDTITVFTPEGRLVVDDEPTTEAEMTAIMARLLADAGVQVSAESPVVVTQIWDNTVRASVSMPPVADQLDATCRIYRSSRTTFDQLVAWDALSPEAAEFLKALQRLPAASQLYTGAPMAGKTTLAGAALRAVPATTNIRIIQEARELSAPHHPGGRWSPDGGGHTIRSLVNRALQFAPGLIVIGETRGAEAFELLKASNSGCGFVTTLHADSASMAMDSLVLAALMAGENVPEKVVRRAFAQLLDVVVYCEAEPVDLVPSDRPMRRQVMEIATVPSQLADDHFTLEPVFARKALGEPMEFTGGSSLGELAGRLDRVLPRGITTLALCEGNARLP
jgi:pilus assembly protein CpaF